MTADRIYGALIRLDGAVDYDAIDGEPVDLIFMMLVPADSKTTQHLKVLAHISRFLKHEETCQAIRATCEQEKIATLMVEWARSQAA